MSNNLPAFWLGDKRGYLTVLRKVRRMLGFTTDMQTDAWEKPFRVTLR